MTDREVFLPTDDFLDLIYGIQRHQRKKHWKVGGETDGGSDQNQRISDFKDRGLECNFDQDLD